MLSLTGRAMWKRAAGWETVADQDLEHWAPLGPDPPGYLERTPATAAGPLVMIGWGFGSTRLTLYGYRALESVLHVYPKARVRFITIGAFVSCVFILSFPRVDIMCPFLVSFFTECNSS